MPGPSQSLTLVAEAGSLRQATTFVREGAVEAKLPEPRIGELDLVIEEIFMNHARYAYPEGTPGTVRITYSIPAQGELHVEIADRGRAFNPLTNSPPNLTLDLGGRPVGGLGIFLVKSFTNSLTYCREEGWNRLAFGISAGS